MNNKDIIKSFLNDFIKDQKIFTSVDLSNKIKQEGMWISNTEVANELKDIFNNEDIFDGYATQRTVLEDNNGTRVNALVYYPCDQKSSDAKYVESITPQEFDRIVLSLNAKKAVATQPVVTKPKTTRRKKADPAVATTIVVDPVVSSVVTPVASSVVTPVASSVVTPSATSVVTPSATSVVTPSATSVVTPSATSVVTPSATTNTEDLTKPKAFTKTSRNYQKFNFKTPK